eukprot:gene17718-20811_t
MDILSHEAAPAAGAQVGSHTQSMLETLGSVLSSKGGQVNPAGTV